MTDCGYEVTVAGRATEERPWWRQLYGAPAWMVRRWPTADIPPLSRRRLVVVRAYYVASFLLIATMLITLAGFHGWVTLATTSLILASQVVPVVILPPVRRSQILGPLARGPLRADPW